MALYVLPFLALVAEKARTLRRALRDHDERCARADRCAVVDCGEGPDAPRASLAMARAIVCCTPDAALGLLDRFQLAIHHIYGQPGRAPADQRFYNGWILFMGFC